MGRGWRGGQAVGVVLHPPHDIASAGGVARKRLLDGPLGGELDRQHGRVDQRAVAPCPRFGAIAWAASPTSTSRPSHQRAQSTRTTSVTSSPAKDPTRSSTFPASGSAWAHSRRKATRSRLAMAPATDGAVAPA